MRGPYVAIILHVEHKAQTRLSAAQVIACRGSKGEAGLPPCLEGQRRHGCVCSHPPLNQHILVHLHMRHHTFSIPAMHLLLKVPPTNQIFNAFGKEIKVSLAWAETGGIEATCQAAPRRRLASAAEPTSFAMLSTLLVSTRLCDLAMLVTTCKAQHSSCCG